MNKPLQHKTALITGASQGLGLEIAKAYVEAGANVAICARDTGKLNAAQKELLLLAAANQRIIAFSADVSNKSNVDAFVGHAIEHLGQIDILVNNAGIYGPKGTIEDIDWSEWVRAIEINIYGSVLMCRAILPHFKAARQGKIIQLSGGGATNPLPNLSAYAVSKAAIVRFIETLAGEAAEFNIDVNAIAPGALNTGMLDEILAAGPDKVGHAFYERSLKQKETGGTSLNHGAGLAVFLGSQQSNGISGKLISAVWDRWEQWPQHLAALQNSDAYTLRRITGRDRGLDWGDK